MNTKLKGQTGACFNQDYMATDWNFFQRKRCARKEIEVREEDDQIIMGIPIYSGEKKVFMDFEL